MARGTDEVRGGGARHIKNIRGLGKEQSAPVTTQTQREHNTYIVNTEATLYLTNVLMFPDMPHAGGGDTIP